MNRTVTILYNNEARGVYSSLPAWQDDECLTQRHILSEQLAQHNIGLSLVRITFPNERRPAQVLQTTNPVFYSDGRLNLKETLFKPADLSSLDGVIMDRIGLERLKKSGVELPASTLPVINHSSIQQLGNKLHTYDQLLVPLCLGIPTFDLHSLNHDSMPRELAEASRGIFVKPAQGRLSLGIIYFSTYQAFQTQLPALRTKIKDTYVVQPEYSFTHQWLGILPYSAQDADKLSASNVSGVHKELRVYCFYDARFEQKARCFPIGRVAVKGEEFMYGCDRFFINPSSCPPELQHITIEIADRSAKITGQRAFFIAVDFGFGGISDEVQPAWEVMEVNSYHPYLGFLSQHDEVGAAIQTLQTEHLVHLINVQG